jgi:lysophospholipase L1-like esterase
MRIIIFTDSLGRPRPDISDLEKTVYEDVYGYKLKEYFLYKHEIELIYIESLDTQDAIHWSQRMVAFRNPDLVIFHIGVNDCVPRLFKKNTNSIIFNKLFRKITFDFSLKLMSYFRYSITKIRKLVYVDRKDFKTNFSIMCDEILRYNNNCKFFCVSIAKSDKLDEKSFNYNKNIIDYNKVLSEIFQNGYIEINEIINKNGLISDHIHLTIKSHKVLFEIIKNKIQELEK